MEKENCNDINGMNLLFLSKLLTWCENQKELIIQANLSAVPAILMILINMNLHYNTIKKCEENFQLQLKYKLN